jgi:dihydropteroate synthase
VGEEEELRRVLPVVQALIREGIAHAGAEADGPVVSVDTNKAPVARAVLEAGAAIINDVSAFRFDPGLLDVLVQYQPGYVLMHSAGLPKEMQRQPQYKDVVSNLLTFFEERLNILARAGLDSSRIVLDPGIGFGKTLEHNLDILRHIDRFKIFGLPIYMGLSNKSMFGDLLGLPVDQRGAATQVATALLGVRQVAIHRVHDVCGASNALTLAKAMTQA